MRGWYKNYLNPHLYGKGGFRHFTKWETPFGSMYRKSLERLGFWLMKIGRKAMKTSGGRCSWCGRNPYFDSVVSVKGFRCTECADKPDATKWRYPKRIKS